MHGFMTPAAIQADQRPTIADRARLLWRKYRWFILLVIAPTLLVGGYLFGMASDQYVSEAHYLVKSQGSQPASSSGGIGAALGFGGGGGAVGAMSEAQSVSDYLTSHDVVEALQKRVDLVAMFHRPEADALSRLMVDKPTPEFLLDYYQKQVDVYYDLQTGITTLKARAFRRDDAYRLASTLLALGEQRVNDMNVRSFADAVALSRRQRDEAEQALADIQVRMTSFRQAGRDVDPENTATAQINVVSRLTQELSAARAQLQTTSQLIGPQGPQAEALRQQIRSLQAQVDAQSGRLAGGGTAIAAGLGNYERLKIQQEMMAKRYQDSSIAFEQARQQAVRQQLYLVRVVNANMPVKSTYPQRGLTLLTLFCVLLVAYAIGWLIAAGVREHAV